MERLFRYIIIATVVVAFVHIIIPGILNILKG